MAFDLVQEWKELVAQVPELPIQDFGLTYIYPVFVVLIIIEYLKAKELFDLKETLSGFVIAAGATVMRLLTNVFEISVYLFLFAWAEPFREQYLGYDSLGFAWYIWLIAAIADDHNFYWHHRLSHNIRLLWAAHLPHHSARTFNLTVSIRNGWFITLYKPIFWLWMPLVGFEPIMIASVLIVNAMYQFFLHSQLIPSLGWYEKVFNTPYVHVVHHSCNTEYLDRNHGGILTIWDRLYGTWQEPIKGMKPKFGISHDPDSYDPIKHNLFEFQEIWRDVKKAPTLKAKLMYIFGPPGWSHDGSSKTSRQLQAELKAAAQAQEKAGAQLRPEPVPA
ncbi:MAG TPA: sterol desaturase family protein [Flavobacteriales bacterium]|nr:sterol desaturase family protein [Flavobacteriales bacterium]HOP43906.1 sterol desaturase family protein [Flavobacteriales bacterium]